jgi:DNA-binding XRE family transcriptional regulator
MNYLSYFKDEKQIQKAIANGLLNIRKQNNLTQEKLAEILDVSIEHISRIENCRYTCSITLVFKICSIFNMSIDEFFGVSENLNNSELDNFFKGLSLEKRNAIYQFCKEVENNLK